MRGERREERGHFSHLSLFAPLAYASFIEELTLFYSMRRIDEIIIHCSATPEGRDYTVADITRWHMAKGFRTIGYHFVIYRDGSIHDGRPLAQVGAHCRDHNAHSIGVCYIGGLAVDGRTPCDTRTTAQKESLQHLIQVLRVRFPRIAVHGHRDYAPKACPSFDATVEYQKLR